MKNHTKALEYVIKNHHDELEAFYNKHYETIEKFCKATKQNGKACDAVWDFYQKTKKNMKLA